MSSEARSKANLAGQQAKHAASNSGRAVEAAADEVTKEVVRFIPSNLTKGLICLGVSLASSAGSAYFFGRANRDSIIAAQRELNTGP